MSKRRSRAVQSNDINALQEALQANQYACVDGPRRKRWSIHDMKSIRPKTETQMLMFDAWKEGHNVVGYGSAGTGKSLISLAMAFADVLNHDSPRNKVIIVRSIVETRSIGFLPGTKEEKFAPYETPYKDICQFLFGRKSTYDDMKDADVIEFHPTSFIRGISWDDAVVIVEEAQNMTLHELHSVMTRLGTNSRIIVNGDGRQVDIGKHKTDQTGFHDMLRIAANMKEFKMFQFLPEDIVRSGFVRSWIEASETLLLAA